MILLNFYKCDNIPLWQISKCLFYRKFLEIIIGKLKTNKISLVNHREIVKKSSNIRSYRKSSEISESFRISSIKIYDDLFMIFR